ncbi:TonB-dependent outer membrane receptor, SusC/RagA subfamily, signature region [Parafilimonas terrae]|uniref:TonB-dependent outer membrane receptor, SusC/RagA subfamily, signature region n=2 Tax=Parafilimonas terrae TaxID=1465490 RepID=A0A1I5RKI3_9BACT|nr:TonB-dependent outer membrane receptor, SusC/RagA subfamily, signature region [Parafilimonas terrae]
MLTAIICCSLVTSAQTASSYAKQWEEIDSLIVLKDLPKTALKKVNILYNDAKVKSLHDEIIKALLYRLSLENKTTDDDINNKVVLLKAELHTTNDAVSKAILSVILANTLKKFYSQNAWKNRDRKETDIKEADVATWSNAQFKEIIDSLYAAALISKQILQQTNTNAIKAILIKGNMANTRPTLYDLLAHEALDYYKTGLAYLSRPAYTFELTDVHALANAQNFMQYNFVTKDTASHILKTLHLYQELLRFHKIDADPSAFIDVNLERINWANARANIDDKEALYVSALTDAAGSFPNAKPAAEAWYLLAKLEADKASSYNALTDTTQRFGYVKSKKIITERLTAMPDSCYGNEAMKSLLNDIEKPELNTNAESVNVPNMPFRLLVNYRNIDTLYARLLLQKDIDKPAKKKHYNRWEGVALLSPLKTFIQPLPQTKDYQQHAVEIRIDGLPVGNYSILFSNNKDFSDDKDKLALQPITVSGLAYLRNGFDYFVVDRESGQPLQNVKITGSVSVQNEQNKEWSNKKFKILYTDSTGHFVLPFNNNAGIYGDVKLMLQKGNDKLETGDYLYSYRNSYNNDNDEVDDSTYEEDNSRVYFFTDRSIYRPGQTVFYKGIVLTKDGKTKQQKLYNYTDSIEVDLYDANGKQIDSMFVMLNEYGSFAGKFLLPENVLTGEFSIETLDFDGEAEFNVEEYKRPTFYVEFDTLKGSYRLNDTITVTGIVKSYAGSNIDNARISYNIQRTANFPYSYLFWRTRMPYSSETQIADSIISTDVNGVFKISFVSKPDSSIEKQTEPLFNFKIELSATDANGETRESSTSVMVGYKSMVVQANVPSIAEVNNFKNIFITTKNNSAENIPANVDIVIKRLKTPEKAYRKRLWQQPDQFVMDKNTFEQYFPYDEYKAETDYHEWAKLGAVVKDTFNTTNTSSYKLPEQLQQGWYCIEVSAKDKYGDTIKDVCYVQLYDMNAAGLPSPQTNFSQNISNTGAPGDKAQLLIGTSDADVFVIKKLSRGDKNVAGSFQYINLNNNKKQIEYTIQPTDHDNIGLYYAFIKHNRFYTGGMQVYIANEVKNLDITYSSFRNKTEPGSKETWTVQVANNDGTKAGAELLTSMYDVSLDQFKKHEWALPYFNTNSYVNNDWRSSLLYVKSSEESYPGNNNNLLFKARDHIAQSADEFWNIYSFKRIYKLQTEKHSGRKIKTEDYDKQFTTDPEFMAMRLAARDNKAVVTAYGVQKKTSVTVAAASIQIRGTSSLNEKALLVIDGVISDKSADDINAEDIDNIIVLKGSEATALYGAKAANGAIVITTKEFALRNGKKKEEEPQVQIRKNFNETAFFYPQLHADSAGNYSFSFTMPEALTTWKWMSLAHTKDAAFGLKWQNIITQKTLMVQPGLPRFLRQGDTIDITAKLTNLSGSVLTGKATLQLFDAINNEPLNDVFKINITAQNFNAAPDKSTVVNFPVNIPRSFTHPLIVKIIAQSGRYSDGEERILPVLSNRLLVTETLPLYMPGEGSKTCTFEKLLNNNSSTLTNESLTVEYTPNPVWYVVQSLPYLMQFPHECAEQTFNRFYANVLGAFIVSQNPSIKNVFNKWKQDTTAMESNLETNPELKQILLNETPWVSDANGGQQQKRNIALLFDSAKMNSSMENILQQLKQMQKSNGAFAWFSGGNDDRYITQYILTGIGKLKKLNAIPALQQNILNEITNKALLYADKEAEKEYEALVKRKADLTKEQLTPLMIQYWYMRSFFGEAQHKSFPAEALDFYMKQAEQYWMKQTPYLQGMVALALNRLLPVMQPLSKFKNSQLDIIKSLKENAVKDVEKGIYWKNNSSGYYWYQSPLEAQSLLINAFEEIAPGDTCINAMRRWLILNKQVNNWETTKATADACYALLSGNNINTQNLAVNIKLGDLVVSTISEMQESGSGYIKHSIDGKDIRPAMSNIEVSVSNPVAKSNNYPSSYGAVYWQYFEDMDKITAATSPLSVSKKLFIEKSSDKGKMLYAINEKDTLKTGDKIIVRLTLKTDRDMDYVYLKDLRAASMEPVNVLSGYKWRDGFGYYESTKDAASNFFIDHLSKGTYILEYAVYITHAGIFSAGIASVQCMYAPEFSAHSESTKPLFLKGE